MKNNFITALLLLIATAVFSQSNCDGYYPFKEGTSFEITSYNPKGKAESVSKSTITNIQNTGGGTEATFSTNVSAGKDTFSTEYKVLCKGDVISIDFKSLMNPEMTSKFGEDVKVDISGIDVQIPNNLSAGQTLPDAEVQISVDMGMMKMKTNVTMANRKVEGTESVTTPAGTFDCVVITYDSMVKTMGINKTLKSKQWLAKGVGMVKHESYTEKGKLMGYELLTGFSK